MDRLRLEHYEDAEVRAIVERLGSKLERFLKSAVWPDADANETLEGSISRLKAHCVSKSVRNALHSLRELYNDAKHAPGKPIRLKSAVDATAGSRAAIASLIDMNLGSTAEPVEKVISRLLWVSAYDVYVGGVTEVYVSLPLPDDDFATHLDLVWVKGLEWDNLKAELLATGSFYYGKEHFPPLVYEKFREGDFLNAGIWDGDYRQLIQIISKYEDRPTAEKLIPHLRRDYMSIAVLSSIALAAVDVASRASHAKPLDELREAILEQADRTYAMPNERPWVRAAAESLAEMLIRLPFEAWRQLSGPFWNLWNPRPLTALIEPAAKATARYIIDDANRVVIV